jgi:N-methylhydantoinase A
MLGALRVITVQRGLDPRDFGIVAFGGAGPLHANALAALLGCYPVIVPPRPGVFSALGFVQSAFKNEFTQTLIRAAAALDPDEVWRTLDDLSVRATDWLAGEHIPTADRMLAAVIDMRYEQQGFEVAVALTAPAMAARDMQAVIAQYHNDHERLYGVRFDVPVELVAVRVIATGRTPGLRETSAQVMPGTSLTGHRPAFFVGSWHDTPCHDRTRLAPGAVVQGPAIVDQYDSTSVILPGHRAEVDAFGNLLIWPATEAV